MKALRSRKEGDTFKKKTIILPKRTKVERVSKSTKVWWSVSLLSGMDVTTSMVLLFYLKRKKGNTLETLMNDLSSVVLSLQPLCPSLRLLVKPCP